MTNDIPSIREIQSGDLDALKGLVPLLPFIYEPGYFDRAFLECQQAKRKIFIAADGAGIVGFVHLNLEAKSKLFRLQGIPEIEDLNVLSDRRGQGIGRRLIDACETAARTLGKSEIGIAVGLHQRFGAAQRLYIKKGYLPTGDGIHHEGVPVKPGEFRVIDDYLVLLLTKGLG